MTPVIFKLCVCVCVCVCAHNIEKDCCQHAQVFEEDWGNFRDELRQDEAQVQYLCERLMMCVSTSLYFNRVAVCVWAIVDVDLVVHFAQLRLEQVWSSTGCVINIKKL